MDVDDADGAYRGGFLAGLTHAIQAPAFRLAHLASTHHPLLRQELAQRHGAGQGAGPSRRAWIWGSLTRPPAARPRPGLAPPRNGLSGRVLLGFTAHLNVACQLELLFEALWPWLRRGTAGRRWWWLEGGPGWATSGHWRRPRGAAGAL